MSDIYVVTYGEYSDYSISAVFSTQELADAYVTEFNKDNGYQVAQVEVFPLDSLREAKRLTIFTCSLHRDGQVLRTWDNTDIQRTDFTKVERLPDSFLATSAISAEHAMKLAVEARQAWQRENI